MGVRNQKLEVLERSDSKTLDSRFTTEIQQGLNCLGPITEMESVSINRTAARLVAGQGTT